MIKLNPSDYYKVIPLISSKNELTVFSGLENIIENEVFVDSADLPLSVLIKVPGKNYLAGYSKNKTFNTEVSHALNFWDQLTLDDEQWASVITECHPNKYIRLYKRRRYELQYNDWNKYCYELPEGYILEKVNLLDLREKNYKNADKIYEWTSDYKNDDNFMVNGIGFFVRTNNEIVSWSLSDGHYKDKIAIGIVSKEEYRRKGLSIATVAATVKECFKQGFSSIDWLCVDFNKGSRAIAEKIGFKHMATYDTYTSYPPCENPLDLSEEDWNNWGGYYENVTPYEPRLLGEQLFAYVKANNVMKSMETIFKIEEQQKVKVIDDLHWIKRLPGIITYFQSIGMCSNFLDKEWKNFVKEHTLLQE